MAEIVEITDGLDEPTNTASVEGYVLALCEEWRMHVRTNYYKKWDEFNRLWRGQWAQEDSTRKNERAKIVTPALQQAVESSVAEVEEATFGRGSWFDIHDDVQDKEKADVGKLKNLLAEDFKKYGVRSSTAECLINAAVYGTGIAEVAMDDVKELKPATEDMMDGQVKAFGTSEETRPVVRLRPVHPKNFLIDPASSSIEAAHGVAIDEFVSRHHVERLMREGVYRKKAIGNASTEYDLEVDPNLQVVHTDGRVRLLKYYGLVPKYLLELANADDDDAAFEDLLEKGADDLPDEWDLVEAVVVIANESHVLKAEETPFMMKDRPLVAFSWDRVPGVFWGRGVCEKGYSSQKALDAEIRGRIEALGLTVHPMMGVDASRLVRGQKPVIGPGRLIPTNGNPSEILQPFNFGQVSQVTFAQAEALQDMVQAATGAVDSVGIAGQVNGEATAAGISMSLGAIIKRQKRTLINFQDNFLIPFVEKAAWRYMQFDPERYGFRDVKFVPTSTLGIIAREYEVTQLTQLLQTMSPQSPAYPALISAIVENMNLSNREELLAVLERAQNPSEEEVARIQRAQEAEMARNEGHAAMFQGQANELNAKAEKARAEARYVGYEAETNRIRAAAVHTNREDQTEVDFERRLKIADLRLREREVNIKSNESKLKTREKRTNDDAS